MRLEINIIALLLITEVEQIRNFDFVKIID